MSNSYFQFKQFRIEQGDTAMKVSTDACIQGAWTPVTLPIKNILDIGAGTGLLSLMLAQRTKDAMIDALEINEAAATQARDNVASSPWKDRITITNTDAKTFATNHKYDLIICNPPFFNNSLLGPNATRNQARHSLSLTQEDLFVMIKNNLAGSGYASVMLPVAEHQLWEHLLADQGWWLLQSVSIKDNDNAPIKRIISCCTPQHQAQHTETLVIKQYDGNYTAQFIDLLQPFYLNL